MTLKKTFLAALSCATALFMLSACSSGTAVSSSSEAVSSEAPASSGHTHTADLWDRDVNEHWQLCECGETFNSGKHALDENMICADCGSEIWMSDADADIYNYNENGDWTRVTSCDADGSILDDYRWDYESGANGGYEKISYYCNDILVEETDYTLNSDGSVLSFAVTTYYDDGIYTVGEFTAEYEPIISYEYDSDGTELFRYEYEYAEADGGKYLAKVNSYQEGILNLVQEYNPYGDDILFREIDENGETVTEMINEYTYTDAGDKESMKFYVNGTLVQENFYTTIDGQTYDHMMIYHNEDGTKNTCEYDQYGELTGEIVHDASGNVLEEYVYENEYNADGDILSQNVYCNGVLTEEYLYTVEHTDDFWNHYLSSVTVYNEDGTKTVSEYNADDELVKETTYDAGGNIVE